MSTWALTVTTPTRWHTVIGRSPTPQQGLRELITVTEAMIGRGGDERPRYLLHLDEHLAAIIQTSNDEHGAPDHAGAAELLAQLAHPRNPFSH